METKFAIGCLIQWYECDIIEEYVESLKDTIKNYNGEVIVDFTITTNEDLKKCINVEQKNKCIDKIGSVLLDFDFSIEDRISIVEQTWNLVKNNY